MGDVQSDAAETRLNRLLNLILETAVEVLGFDAATVTARYQRGGMSTIAATDQRLVELDDAQYDGRSGPCLSVLDQSEPIYLEDASVDDPRWQHFSRTAAQMGVHSTLSVHVPTDAAEVAASLNFYARRRYELGDQQVRAAESFAEQLAAAVQSVEAYRSTARLAEDLAEAMRSRAVIEQAKGILMADERVDADRAFERLVELSQHSNTKLREVAQRLVADRSTPPGA
ncbi:MAG TPA: GAF and ANTAR domain-containing protein [Gaiellales bacterium]